MAWVQVRDLGAISVCEIPFRCRRDCAEIAYLHPGHLEKLQSSGGHRECRGDIHNARDGWVATISAKMAACGAWEFQARFGARSHEGAKRAVYLLYWPVLITAFGYR